MTGVAYVMGLIIGGIIGGVVVYVLTHDKKR